MAQTKTTTQKTYEKFDAEHYLLYFNESEEEVPAQEEGGEAQKQYVYDTVLAACKEPAKGNFVDAIIRSEYSESDELAIHRHYASDPEAYAAEWKTYNDFCENAKAIVKNWGL